MTSLCVSTRCHRQAPKRERKPSHRGPTGSRIGRIHPGGDGLHSPRFHGRRACLPRCLWSLVWYQLLPLRQLEHKFRIERARARRNAARAGGPGGGGARGVGGVWRVREKTSLDVYLFI